MITPEEFLKAEVDMGISFDNAEFVNLTNFTAEQMQGYGITTVLDYGAGTGVYSDAFHKLGFKVKCFEIWEAHLNYIKDKAPHLEVISKPVTTDLMLFIEVAEHMTDKELKALFKKIKPKYILFSSTSKSKPEWDEQWGHINIKSQSDWVDLFFDFGYKLSKELSLPTPYTKLFELNEQEK
jgi:2-polyprenyl-3-methyl-5-hydroxy-6-metoxy-1,4-benzoquinol methylase